MRRPEWRRGKPKLAQQALTWHTHSRVLHWDSSRRLHSTFWLL